MKKLSNAVVMGGALMFLVGCKPDLTVQSAAVTWNATTKKATARIANIGQAHAGRFMLYFDGEEEPVSSNYRPQVSFTIDGLAKGQTLERVADFAPLARPENDSLRRIYMIRVAVDPKNMVIESNESNNVREVPVE